MGDAELAVAPTPLVTSWSALALDTDQVQRELDRLWTAWTEAKREARPEPAVPAADGALMRASTLNLIAIAESIEDAIRIESAVASLTEFTPSRTVILVRAGQSRKHGLDVRVSVHERSLGRGQPAIRYESITVAARPGSDDLLASVTAPLLVPELPDFLWVPGGPLVGNALFAHLLELADRVIVDSAALFDLSESLRHLADLARQPPPVPRLSDVVWTRLTPWRQVIAQFFDQPTTQPCLETIDEVAVVHGGKDARGRSGLTAGLLMAGWLATRLGWRAPGELVQSRDGWRLTLRAGKPGRSREVILTLRETDLSCAQCCLGSVTLIAGGAAPGQFTVERTNDQGITTTSETPTMPRVSRLVYGRLPDDRQLLSQELRNFGGDPIFEQALIFAADLWPEGVKI